MEKKTLYRYFGNCATEEERIQVLEWTKASPENLKEFCRERNIYNAILLSTDNIQRTKYDFRRHYRAQLLRIAAVVILLLSVAFGSFYLTMGDRIVPLYSLTVPAGNSNTLLLPDGTKVWLNAGSTIKYPSSFLGMQRNIEIEGEAYLEVAHNRWKPFIVNTPNGKVKVLGTKFYVTSTLKEKDFMVSLIEGSVKISSGEKSAMLKPGYRAQFKDGEFKQSVIRTFETELWKDGIECNKAVIKAGEEFTLSLIDPNQEEPFSWEIFNATTSGNAVFTQDGSRSITTSLSEEGYYDVKLTKGDLSELSYRGYVQISPESTGAIPSITDFTASDTNVTLEDGTAEVTLSYTGKKNEGTVSRGLQVDDPYMFRIPSDFLPMNQNQYSICLWIKPEKFTFAKFGMGLIEQRNMGIHWPDNNWGALWVDVWPETFNNGGQRILDNNIISYTMWGNESQYYFNGNNNKHEIPNLACCTDGNRTGTESYSLSEGQWAHVLISFDGSKQRIYFNGKKVGEGNASKYNYNDNNGGTGNVKAANIYIGGSRVYYAGFSGVIDDVQVWHKALSDTEVIEAMKGYDGKEIPSDLKGYWTFESDNYNEGEKVFENKGTLVTDNKAAYIEVKGAGGKNTSANEEHILPANIAIQGNPAMSGTLPITTTSTFAVADAEVQNTGDNASVTFNKDGKYNVTLTLANGWGSDTKTKEEYIVVLPSSGIDGNLVDNLTVYPNPFIENVNLQFAADGNYVIDIFDAQGRQVTTKKHQAMAGEICTLTVNAAKGMYYVVVSKDGKRVKSFKVVAE